MELQYESDVMKAGVDIIEGRSVYCEFGNISWWRRWDELTEEQQQKALEYKQLLEHDLNIIGTLCPSDIN